REAERSRDRGAPRRGALGQGRARRSAPRLGAGPQEGRQEQGAARNDQAADDVIARMWTRARASALVACALVLAACATPPRVKTDDAMLARQGERERALANQPSWQLAGRLGVSNAKDSGSGSLQWKQDGDAFRFSVHAPVTGKTWVLTGDAHRAV